MYRAVLERVVGGMVAIHERFRDRSGTRRSRRGDGGHHAFAAANLSAVRVLSREIMDGGPHVAELAREHLRPLFAAGAAEVARNMERGRLPAGGPDARAR